MSFFKVGFVKTSAGSSAEAQAEKVTASTKCHQPSTSTVWQKNCKIAIAKNHLISD